MKLIRLMVLASVLLLSACAGRAPLPAAQPSLELPLQLHIEQTVDQQRQDWVLVIQREGAGLRWSMMDLLGIPQARQILQDGEWQADGLLPGAVRRLAVRLDPGRRTVGQLPRRLAAWRTTRAARTLGRTLPATAEL